MSEIRYCNILVNLIIIGKGISLFSEVNHRQKQCKLNSSEIQVCCSVFVEDSETIWVHGQ